jgi:aspartyl-tRNA synthetase
MASDWKTAVNALGAVSNHLGKELGLVKKDEFNFCMDGRLSPL